MNNFIKKYSQKGEFLKKIIVIAVLVTYCFTINAEVLTLKDLKETALKNNPELLENEHKKKSADYDYNKSMLGLIPSASFNGNYSHIPDQNFADENPSFGLSVSQTIFDGGKKWLSSRIHKDKAKIVALTYNEKRLETIANVESKYLSVLENKDLLETAKKYLQSSEKQLEIAKMRFEDGTLSKINILQLQSQKASQEISLIQTENKYSISRLDLANFLQIRDDFKLEDISPKIYEDLLQNLKNLEIIQVENLISEVVKMSKENNVSLIKSELTQSINKKTILKAGGDFLPSVNLSYSNNWSKNEITDSYEDSQKLSLSASIPIFPIADNAVELVKAKNDYKTSFYNYQSTKDGLKLSLKSSVYNLVTSAKSVDATSKALEYARQTYLHTEEKFKHNIIAADDLLDAEILLFSSENQYTQSIYDLLRERSSLLKLIGVEDAEILNDILLKLYTSTKNTH